MAGFFLKNTIRHIFRTAPILVLAAIFLLSTALPAWATISRVNSLGGGGDFFEDDSNVLRWYGSLADYPNQAVLESGNFNIPDGYWLAQNWKRSGPGIGAHLNLGNEGQYGTAALYFHDHDQDRSSSPFQDHLRNNLSLIYVLDLGPLTAGLALRHGSRSKESPDTVSELSATTIGGGLRMDLSESAYLDLAGEVRIVDDELNPEADFTGIDANQFYSFRGRAFIALGSRMALVPMMEFIHEDLRQAFAAPGINHNRLQRYGVGLNYFPDTDHLLLFNAEYADGSENLRISNMSLTKDWSALILKVGLETRVLSWLTTRGSVGFVDYDVNTDLEGGLLMPYNGFLEDPIFRVNLGASIHLGPADLDFAFGERYPESRFLAEDLIYHKHWLSITARLLF